MKNTLPTYEFLIDDTEESGVKCISIVSSPAMQSDFLKFNSQEKRPKYIFLSKDEKEYKGIVAGLSMIPNKLIYRIDEMGEEYNGYFSEATIEKIRNKYHKEVLNLQNVNLEHSAYNVSAYLIESYILDTEDRVNEVQKKGIKEACLGAWYTAFKVEDKAVFDACVAGEFNGFSIEAMLDMELKLSKNNSNNKIVKKMKKNLAERIKEEFNKILSTILLEEALVPDLNITLSWGSVGEQVTKTYTNADSIEVTEPTGKGEFTIEDGRVIVVDENSALVEIRDAAPVVETPVETPAVSGDTTTTTGDTPTVSGSTETALIVEELVVSGDTAPVVPSTGGINKTIAEVVGTTDGEYWICVKVENGVITEANLQAESELMSAQNKFSAVETTLKSEIEALKTKLSESIAEPILTNTTPINTGNVKELTVYEAVCQRNGIQPV